MCGISGFFGEGNAYILPRMLETIRHRGPDDVHWESGHGFGLGACRLSILDTAHGRQPMWSEDQGVCVAQNGEIYNSPGLREELKKRGRSFQGHCDTEILAPLYQEFGESAWPRLEGMFAVGLWDARSQKGYLVRDRCGKKPLFYTRIGRALYFASEIKALLAVPGCSRQIDPEALQAYLGLKHVPGPASAFLHIRQVPPGHILKWEASSQEVAVSRYWSLSPKVEAPVDSDQVVSKFLGLLREAVERRLLSDVPVGFFLSGGLDSSLVTALAAEVSSTPIQTFTLTLDGGHATPGKEADRVWASWVARRFQTRHREEKIEVAHLASQLRDVVRCFDEPFAGVISPYFLSRAMARHVKVALCGDGADELFGSYLSHRLGASLETGTHAYRRTAAEDQLFEAIGSDSFPVWRSRLEVFTAKESRALLAPVLCPGQGTENLAENRWRQAAAPFVRLSPLNQVLAAEFVTFLPDQILKYADRLSMAHSLEVRSPFLDRTVVEYVAGLPAEWKIRGQETKYLMRLAAARYFPREMIERPKEGFLMPVAQWLRTSLRPLVEECLETGRLQKQGILHPPEVDRWKKIWEKGDPADYRLANKIYSLLVLSLWADAYVR
jgi:asparagine synthase (glutamine-hydrolysing)